MNGVAYWFSDRIALASARAREVSPAEAPMLYRLADRLAAQYGVMVAPHVFVAGKDGKVVNRNAQVATLEEDVRKLLP